MSITTLVEIFSAPMPKSPGGLVVRASDWYLEDPGSIPTVFSCIVDIIYSHVHYWFCRQVLSYCTTLY